MLPDWLAMGDSAQVSAPTMRRQSLRLALQAPLPLGTHHPQAIPMTPSSLLRAYLAHDLGGDLHRLAQRAAVVAAAVYVAGMAAGVVIHWANDWLSGDRRPWPVTWGAVAKPDPLSSMVSPAWIIDKSGHGSFVDLASLSVDELRILARLQGLRVIETVIHARKIGLFRELHLARKADIIAALQCTP